METEVLSAIVGAGLGAAFTYGCTLLQQHGDRRRVRRSFATMLLGELQAADATLRAIYARPTGGTLSPEEFPLLRSPSVEMVGMFSPTTIQQLLSFGSYLRMATEGLGRIRSGGSRSEVAWNAGVVTAAAARAVTLMAGLKISLEREGGIYTPLVVPAIPPMDPEGRGLPPLPPSPFSPPRPRGISGPGEPS